MKVKSSIVELLCYLIWHAFGVGYQLSVNSLSGMMALNQRIFLQITLIYLLCELEACVAQDRVRFPGSVSIKELPESVLSAAPYPAAGYRPDPPFDLPTAEEPHFQPDTSYGPPADTYGPPELPEQIYETPQTAAGFTDATLFFATTELQLPYKERQVAFRPRRRRPSNNRPGRLLVSVGTPPVQGFAQLPPKIFN